MQPNIDRQVADLLAEMRQQSANKSASKKARIQCTKNSINECIYYLDLIIKLIPVFGGLTSAFIFLIALSLNHFGEHKASIVKDFSTEIQPETPSETVEKEVKHKIVCNHCRN